MADNKLLKYYFVPLQTDGKGIISTASLTLSAAECKQKTCD
jgi:hypothetical protein